MKKLFLIKQPIPYEGDNIWVVAADTRQEAVEIAKASSRSGLGGVSVYQLSETSEYKISDLVWTNT